MKKYLLTVLAMVCVSIGAWAGSGDGYELNKDAIGKWSVSGLEIPEEKVIYLKITRGTETVNALQAALGELTTILSGDESEYYKALGADNVTNNRLILKVVYEPANGEPTTLTLSTEDLQALANINVATIDLQDSKIANDGFSVNNSHVRNLILPDGYTKAQVNTAVIGCNSLDAAFSMNPSANITYTYNNNNYSDGISLTAYVASGKGGTLWNAIRRSGYESHKNTKVGTGVDPWNYHLTKVKEVAISGYPSARDYCSGTKNFDANGHFVFDVPAVEQMADQTRNLVGTAPAQGALQDVGVLHLDLSDAIIYPTAEEDLILSKTDIITSATTRVDIPTSPLVTTLPADFLNMDHGICQLLIPGNILYIRTRAFKGHTIDHIWTSDPNPAVKVDNGIVLNDGTTAYGYQASVNRFSDYKWATYTFPAGLLAIETAAFGTKEQRDPRVKDLYVLAQHAPECHVDAFPSIMYMGNNRFDSDQVDADGIVTRDAYLNSNDNNTWITVLHYPRECGTPDVQRYTDPTREYSIATGDVDGNGSPIYYPNQCEFDRAYQQGTTGYLWNAWDDTRTTDGSGAFKNTSIDRHTTFTGWSVENQGAANSVYADNSTTPAETLQFTSFYDVTANGVFNQPQSPTPLVLYSDVYRGGGTLHNGNTTGTYTQLYPSATTTPYYYRYVVSEDNSGILYVKNGDNYELFTGTPETGVTYYNRVQTQARDEDGSLMYETCNNNPQYVEVYRYEKSSNGRFVRDLTVTENPTNGQYVKDYSWVESTTGELYYHPFSKATSSDVSNFSKYYYYNSTEDIYVEDANGLYIKKSDVGQGAGYELASNASSWWGGQYNISELTHYSLKHVWHKCTTEGDYYNHANHPGVWEVSANYVLWSSSASDYESTVTEASKLYNKVYSDPVEYRLYNSATDAGETRYDVDDNGYVPYTDAYAGQQRYDEVPFYRLAEEGETPTHCPVMEDAKFRDVIQSHDYRGWHQFVLTAYSHNSELVFEPLKSYITDNDWWTICAPYDLRRSDMILLFGDKEKNQIPYLSKLVYVVRDVENEKITLMFSKNLMQYKEYEMVGGVKKSINEGSHVHGIVDDTEWTAEEIAADPIILHRGVPYLIKPYMSKDNSGKFNRQFDIYSENQPADLTLPEGAIVNEGLYQEFRRSRSLTGDQQKELIYKGEYRVPAFVINNDGEATQDGDLTITMNDNSSFTYGANSAFSFKNSTYDMKVSSAFTYTFVGTFYKSLMPQYSYFLGWDSKKGKAAFWYNRVNNTQDYTWNNETGIICANWSLDHEITAARGSDLTPARWESAGSGMVSDDFASATGAKGYMDMEFGNAMDLIYSESGVATGVKDVSDNRVADNVVYDIHGVRMGTSVNGLAKGVYIKNGKKIIVR